MALVLIGSAGGNGSTAGGVSCDAPGFSAWPANCAPDSWVCGVWGARGGCCGITPYLSIRRCRMDSAVSGVNSALNLDFAATPAGLTPAGFTEAEESPARAVFVGLGDTGASDDAVEGVEASGVDEKVVEEVAEDVAETDT